MGTGPRSHLQPALWHRHGQARAELGGGRGARGQPASQEDAGQSRAAQPGASGAPGFVAAGRSPRTRDGAARCGAGPCQRLVGTPCWDAGGRARGTREPSDPSAHTSSGPSPNTGTRRFPTRDRGDGPRAPQPWTAFRNSLLRRTSGNRMSLWREGWKSGGMGQRAAKHENTR